MLIQSIIQIIHDRVYPELARPPQVWNSQPGGLFHLPTYSIDLHDYPAYYDLLGKNENYCVLIILYRIAYEIWVVM